jgi:uncharacterized protein (DUF1684 family)
MTHDRDPFSYDRREHEAEVGAWRRARLARLTAPDSWLSLVGRFPLAEGTSSVGAGATCDVLLPVEKAPALAGHFERAGAVVRFTPAAGVAMSLQRRPGSQPLEALEPGVPVAVRTDRDGEPDKLALGLLTLEVTEQPAGSFVRVRDPESPTRRDFPGLEYFPITSRWRVVARLEPHEPPQTLELGYESGSSERYESPGDAVFELDGAVHRVTPVYINNRSRLYLVFRDATAGDTSYGAGRFLYAPLPEAGRVLLDFNEAFSPPCAFTPYAACPLAPLQNRLAVRIEAGEMSRH